jgi:NAD(P)H-dependent flavin oxidoreductase YrpB (nitropropane dioxygenase family)
MGVNVSNWRLAQTISKLGQQGTVSGVALERVVACILQRGDPQGHIRRALSHFPFQNVSREVLNAFYVKGGVANNARFKNAPLFSVTPSNLLIALVICSNYACVWLAKEGHSNPVSINYLEKIAMPHIYAITGAMLASVDFITMGAGIAKDIPDVISCVAEGKTATYKIPVQGRKDTPHVMSFDSVKFFGERLPEMQKPGFLPIVSSNLLASLFMGARFKLPAGSIYGFVVEEPTAGGHNAPPRKPIFNEQGEMQPEYGPKDEVDYSEIAKLGLPFWIGGAKASPQKLTWALAQGAKGIQAGSIFALCDESGMNPEIRQRLRNLGFTGKLRVRTGMQISPTGFPFKTVVLDGSISEQATYLNRPRVCNHGVLVSLYEKADGTLGYRCASEPESQFVAKGGEREKTVNRGCLCNGLLSTADMNFPGEPPIVTLGDDTSFLQTLMADANDSYSAEDAINYLLGKK